MSAALSGPGPLQVLQRVFAMFVLTLVGVGAIAVVLDAGGAFDGVEPPFDAAVAAAVVAGFGVMAFVAVRVVAPPLACESLVGSYRTRMFVRMAIGEMPALLGFVGVVLTGASWVYFVGLAFTAVAFTLVAPTEANIQRDDDEVRAAGCGRSLLAELQGG